MNPVTPIREAYIRGATREQQAADHVGVAPFILEEIAVCFGSPVNKANADAAYRKWAEQKQDANQG